MHKKLISAIILVFPLLIKAQEIPKTEYEIQLDAYYSAAGIYIPLTKKQMEHMGKKNESEVYAYLIKNIHRPKTLVLEASFNPLPYTGTMIKRNWPETYSKAKINKNLNYIGAITEGFEEPWALSLFLGNVVEFDTIKKKYEGKRKGYSGILIDVGDYHIRDNILIYDKWLQGEIKLKGEQLLSEKNLTYSFRAGIKIHDNSMIRDSYFIGLRRSRTDFKNKNRWYQNLGVNISSNFSMKDFSPIRHYFLLEKKFPSAKKRFAFSLGAGFVWDSGKKYVSNETLKSRDLFKIIIRPNIEF